LFGKLVRPPREVALHRAIVELLRVAGHPKMIWYHCPNSALTTPAQRIYFSQLGVLPGVADFCLVPPDKEAAFLEAKGPLGFLSEAQQAFQARCAVLGLRYRAVWEVDEAAEVLREWGCLRGFNETGEPILPRNIKPYLPKKPDAA
jgi:hypothetical protein